MTQSNLAGEFRELGWLAIPAECPARFRDKILERRAAMLANPPRRSRGTGARSHLTVDELRRQCRQVGLDLEAERVRERIAETGMAIEYVDSRGEVAFRGPTDAEWSASLQLRAAQVSAQLRAEAVEDARGKWDWDNRQGCWVSRLERVLKEQSYE